mgnify:CR=1 FL=1
MKKSLLSILLMVKFLRQEKELIPSITFRLYLHTTMVEKYRYHLLVLKTQTRLQILKGI